MLWEFHLNLKNCTCQCLYCVLWISGWQRSWDSVRRGNLPNVTSVKIKKKKKPRCTSFSSSGSWFLGVTPNTKIQGSSESTPLPFSPAVPCLRENRWQRKWGRDPFLAWVKTPSSVCWAFCHHRPTKYSKRLAASQHKDDDDLCHHSWRRCFSSHFLMPSSSMGTKRGKVLTYKLISSHEGRPQSKRTRQGRFLASLAELSREPLKTPGNKSKNPPPEDKNGN